MGPPSQVHPSTQCAPWPHETSSGGHNALANTSAQLIRAHIAGLLADSRRAISPLAIEAMFANNRTQRACMLLRGSNGRLLIDLLDTPWLGHGNIEIASCYPSKVENYIRSRMHVAFRLILRAMRRLQLPDFEVAFCPDDCPPALNAKPNVLPALTTISCNQHRSLPFVAWITQPGQRATDLSEWDDSMQAEWRPITPWAERLPKAVFRGGLRNYSYCGGQPSTEPRYREWITPSNWRTLGRAAIWAARVAHPEQLDVNFGNHEEMAARWELSPAEAAARDDPKSIPMQQQAQRFRYVVHPEGACSSSDRLKQSYASPMLLIKQVRARRHPGSRSRCRCGTGCLVVPAPLRTRSTPAYRPRRAMSGSSLSLCRASTLCQSTATSATSPQRSFGRRRTTPRRSKLSPQPTSAPRRWCLSPACTSTPRRCSKGTSLDTPERLSTTQRGCKNDASSTFATSSLATTRPSRLRVLCAPLPLQILSNSREL